MHTYSEDDEVTDEELIERRKLFNKCQRTHRSAEDNDRYCYLRDKIRRKFYMNDQKPSSEYGIVADLVDMGISDEEILSMSHEERITYVHLFGGRLKDD